MWLASQSVPAPAFDPYLWAAGYTSPENKETNARVALGRHDGSCLALLGLPPSVHIWCHFSCRMFPTFLGLPPNVPSPQRRLPGTIAPDLMGGWWLDVGQLSWASRCGPTGLDSEFSRHRGGD